MTLDAIHPTIERLYAAARTHPNPSMRATNQADIARKMGLPNQQTLGNWQKRGISQAGATQAQERMGISATWVLHSTGPMYISEHTTFDNLAPGPVSRGSVPLLTWVQAGPFVDAHDTFSPEDAERWLECPAKHSPRTFALRVRGDSMTAPFGRSYPEGCIVFVDPEKRSPQNGERIIAMLVEEDKVTFKVYKNEDGRQWLQPLNPHHEPIRKPFRVLGTIIGKWEDE